VTHSGCDVSESAHIHDAEVNDAAVLVKFQILFESFLLQNSRYVTYVYIEENHQVPISEFLIKTRKLLYDCFMHVHYEHVDATCTSCQIIIKKNKTTPTILVYIYIYALYMYTRLCDAVQH
jgi:hypothetical protein